MNLDRIDELILLKEKGSYAAASEVLSVSPGTLRARIRTLEKEIGFPLFCRKGNLLTLTAKGQTFYEKTVSLAEQKREIMRELRHFSELPSGSMRLCIGIIGSGLPFYLGPFLDQIQKHHPQCHLDLVDDTFAPIREGLLSDEVDLYFAPLLSGFQKEGLRKLLLAHNSPHVLLPSAHSLASRRTVSLQELDGECFILYPQTKDTCVRDFQLANLKASGIHYTLYEHQTTKTFYELLVPIRNAVLLSPEEFLSFPPNTVALPVDPIPEKASSTLVCRANAKPEIKAFVTEFLHFIEGEKKYGHGASL